MSTESNPSPEAPYGVTDESGKPASSVPTFEKKKKFNDLIFAVLFIAHLVTVIVVLAW